jgi:uncharacterized protein (DUF1330 family)
MVAFVKTGLTLLVGIGIGVVSMQVLRAQEKPPAYVVSEINVRNQEPYVKEFLPARAKAIQDAGGRYLVRGGDLKAVLGQRPARIAIVQFDNIDALIAFTQSDGFKTSEAIGEKYADFRIYGVEGVPR